MPSDAEIPTTSDGSFRAFTSALAGVVPACPAWRDFLLDESGQDVVEYGILIATVGVVILLAVGAFGSQIQTWFGTLAGRITTT